MNAGINMTEQGEQVMRSNGDRKCLHCVKVDTCLIWRLIAEATKTIDQQIGGEGGAHPVEPMDTAKICDLYTPLSDLLGR